MKVKVTPVETIAAEVETVQRRIESRAAQVYDERGEILGRQPLDDWLTAERETVWRPAFEVRQLDGSYLVEAAVAGVDPHQIQIRATTQDVLITAETVHHHPAGTVALLCEFSAGPLFRSYHFPQPVDPARARAECRDGLLRVTVPLADREQEAFAEHPKP
jgi:HSP20 family protein